MYCIGGLEDNDDEYPSYVLGGNEYLLADKFKTMLRDSLIDWGSFLEVYEDEMNSDVMFKQIIKLLNIKDNNNLNNMLVPILKKIYNLPAKSHMACLLKQFMLYEPVSISIQMLFSTLKNHYEYIVHLFIKSRNKFIDENKIANKTNTWEELLDKWNIDIEKNQIDTSSIILFMLNTPDNIKQRIYYETSDKEVDNVIKILIDKVKRFKYPGFCPKVPHERLEKLLKFPLYEFVNAIKILDPEIEFPDYKKLESEINSLLENKIDKPEIPDIKIEPIDENKIEKIKNNELEIAKLYVSEILEYRKKLLPIGQKYEQYYVDTAKLLDTINNTINKFIV